MKSTRRSSSSATRAPASQVDAPTSDAGPDNSQAQAELAELEGASRGPFGDGALNQALESCFGQSLGGLTANWAGEENEAIGADASCEGSAMSFGDAISEDTGDNASMEIIGHEVAHALAGGGSGETALDTEGDQGEAKADEAGKRFAEWAAAGFEGEAPSLSPATGGKAAIHRHGGHHVTGRPLLRKGSQGRQVSALQACLNAQGERLAVDGPFGPKTLAAVLRIQRALGILVDGIVGPQTAAKLSHGGQSHGGGQQSGESQGGQEPVAATGALTGDPELSFNSRGAMVATLQRQLNEKGASLSVDGVFGAGTDNAVRRFQQANGLGVDGLFGPNTARKLNDPNSKDLAPAGQGGQGGEQGSSFAGNEAYDNLREAVMAAAESHMNKPYYWGADGPGMFDCSGFVLYVLRQDTGLINWGDDTAAGIKNRVPSTGRPQKGDPVFYTGRSGTSHIEFYTGSGTRTLGASGGGSRTKGDDPNARVKYGDYTKDGRSKSFGSIESLIQKKLQG